MTSHVMISLPSELTYPFRPLEDGELLHPPAFISKMHFMDQFPQPEQRREFFSKQICKFMFVISFFLLSLDLQYDSEIKVDCSNSRLILPLYWLLLYASIQCVFLIASSIKPFLRPTILIRPVIRYCSFLFSCSTHIILPILGAISYFRDNPSCYLLFLLPVLLSILESVFFFIDFVFKVLKK